MKDTTFIPKVSGNAQPCTKEDKVLYVLCNAIWEKDGSINEKNLEEFRDSLYSFSKVKECKKMFFSFLINNVANEEIIEAVSDNKLKEDDKVKKECGKSARINDKPIDNERREVGESKTIVDEQQEIFIDNFRKCLEFFGDLHNIIFLNNPNQKGIIVTLGKQFCEDKMCWKSFNPETTNLQDVESIEQSVSSELNSIKNLSSIIGIGIDNEKIAEILDMLEGKPDYTYIEAPKEENEEKRVSSFDNMLANYKSDAFWNKIPDFEGRRKKQKLCRFSYEIENVIQALDNETPEGR